VGWGAAGIDGLLYLVSDASTWVTGQTIRVDGGFIKRVA
jgi:NAD(P)-dependent dehydrogenase (short-subunit alcohol dehydrogenase family)